MLLLMNYYRLLKTSLRTLMLFALPGMKDQITIWENGIKKCKRKYYLTLAIFLQESYKIYTELPLSHKVKFSKFGDLCPKNVFLLKQSPLGKCKCIIHNSNFINKLKAVSIFYDSCSFWDTVLSNNTKNLQYWKGNSEDSADGKKVIVNIDPEKNVLPKMEIY